MLVVPEAQAAGLVTLDEAITAVRDAFVALGTGRAELFPVTGGTGSDPADRFSTKSCRIDGLGLSVKVGSYWPGNALAVGRVRALEDVAVWGCDPIRAKGLATRLGLIDVDEIPTLSDVVCGRAPGRRRTDEITVFDSSGTAIQDLAVCAVAVARATGAA